MIEKEHQNLSAWLRHVVAHPQLHARWLNTLSYLENCGARKIASCQHPTLVKREMLKHAAEEFRHAYHLKRQIAKTGHTLDDYTSEHLLGGHVTLRYLDKLDVAISRRLKHTYGLSQLEVKAQAYHLVTYAIEVRASHVYPLYQEVLAENKSSISMRAIILEEEGHLAEITSAFQNYPNAQTLCQEATTIENTLFTNLCTTLLLECGDFSPLC